MTAFPAPLWSVSACRVPADLPRTADPRAWDVPVAQVRAQLAPTQPDTTPEEAS